MGAKHSRLFIPKLSDLTAIRWRLRLISYTEIADYQLLHTLLTKFISNTLTDSDLSTLLDIINNKDFLLDEVDFAILNFTDLLFNNHRLSDTQIFFLEGTFPAYFRLHKMGMENLAKFPKWYIKRFRHFLAKQRTELFTQLYIPSIRAKLAVLELMAIIAPDFVIPTLVGITPRYLKCDKVQTWITKKQAESHFGAGAVKINAAKLLTNLTKSISGDNRKFKNRKYPYWSRYHYFQGLSDYIISARKDKTKRALNKTIFKAVCEEYKVPEDYKDKLLTP